ncbi:MAG: DUF6785 family protein [Armatimonadota bacterium]
MRGITTRSIVIGALLTIIHTIWVIYEEQTLLHIGQPTIMIPVQTVIGLLFLIMVSNSLFKAIRPSWVLAPAEMMVVFCMTTLAAIICSAKLLQFLFPLLLWPFFIPSSFEGFNKYTQFMPSFFVPQNKDVVQEFFYGGHSFWRFFDHDILMVWLPSITFWSIFLFLMLWTMLCISSILRRQWIDQEKIQFPIIELPLMMMKENNAGSLFQNRLLLSGFSVTFLILSMNYLSCIYPSIPKITMDQVDVGSRTFTTPPFTSMNPILTVWWPYAIGLCYLIPLDVSFSCWFFFVFIRALIVVAAATGLRDAYPGLALNQFPYFGNISEGAWLGMFLVVMWSARGFLKQVWLTVRSSEKIPGEATEAIPYKTAFYGATGGFLALVVIGVFCGMRLHVALIAFTLYFLAVIVITRMYAQIAMPLFCLAFFSFTSWTTNFTGIGGITGREGTMLSSFYWFDFTHETVPMGHQMESLVLADRLNQSKKLMYKVVLLAMIIGIVVGMLTLLQIYYDRGVSSAQMTKDPVWLGSVAWNRLKSWNNNATPVQGATMLKMGVSALIVILLAFARNTWFGFPLHPIGYLFASSFALEWGMWNIIFVTWVIKSIVIKYGGLRVYRKSLPLFFGLALGDAVAHVVWGVALGLLGVKGATAY